MKARVACFVGLLLFACGGPSSGAAADDCAALAKSERTELTKVFDVNQACTKDEDCTYSNWTTKCAFRNSRLIAASARPELEAAVAKVDANQCEAFERKGCTVEREPPADPPRPPACASGRCRY